MKQQLYVMLENETISSVFKMYSQTKNNVPWHIFQSRFFRLLQVDFEQLYFNFLE